MNTNIVSVCVGFDAEFSPLNATLGEMHLVYTKNNKGRMVSESGGLFNIIETSNGKYIGEVSQEVVLKNGTIYTRTHKGYLVIQNQVVHTYECGLGKTECNCLK